MQRVLRSEQPKPIETYQEYPKMLLGPPGMKAPPRRLTEIEARYGVSPSRDEPLTALALDAEHEAELVAQGFISPGPGRREAFMDARALRGIVHHVIEFPKMLTPPDGGAQVLARNVAEERAIRLRWGQEMPLPAAPAANERADADEAERPAPVRLALPAPEPVRSEPLSAAERMKAARERKRAGIVQANSVDVPREALDALVRANLLPEMQRSDPRHVTAALQAVANRLPDLLRF